MTKSFFIGLLTLATLVFSAFTTPQTSKFAAGTVLPAGTSVFLQLNEEVDANQVSVGNALEFTVRRNVTVNGKVLIAANSPATGIIRKVQSNCKKGCGSDTCSKLTIAVESAQAVDGQTVLLTSIPHVVNAPCCKGTASVTIGANLTSSVRNDIIIK